MTLKPVIYNFTFYIDNVLSGEAGLVELTLSGRKTPVLITAPEPMVLAARIEKVVEAIK